MRNVLITQEGIEYLKKCINEGTLTSSELNTLMLSTSIDQFIERMKEIFRLDTKRIKDLFFFLVSSWYGAYPDGEFNDTRELYLFRILLEKGGIISYKEALKCFKTKHMLSTAIEPLQKKRIIAEISLHNFNRKKIYIMDFSFFREAIEYEE